MINAVIIEDELAASEHLKTILAAFISDKIVIDGFATGVKSGIQLIKDCNPKLVFLDIELDDGIGFEILDYFSQNSSFEVIFTTGLTDYKEKAMDYFAFYYLNKPIQPSQLEMVLSKYFEKQSAFDLEKYLAFKNQIENKHNKIALPLSNGSFSLVNTDDIIYCEADGSYTKFVTDNKVYMSSTNLKTVESMLQQASFFRIHRSTLLNLKHISEYNNSGEILLSNKKKLTVSTRNKKNFLRILKFMSYKLN